MKDQAFEDLIRAERNRSLPACPPNLDANVLRRVRRSASGTPGMGPVDWVNGLLPQKRLAFGILTLTLALSVTSSMMVASSSAHAAEAQSRAVTALDFGVFKESPFFDLEN